MLDVQSKPCSPMLNESNPRLPRYEVSSVRKALDILAVFSIFEPEWSLSALARRLHLPKSTAHNLLRTLQCFDLVQQRQERRTYRLGPRALEMGLTFSHSSEVLAQAQARASTGGATDRRNRETRDFIKRTGPDRCRRGVRAPTAHARRHRHALAAALDQSGQGDFERPPAG